MAGMPTRPVTVDDAAALRDLLLASEEHMRPYEPSRATEFFTVEGQRRIIAAQLDDLDAGRTVPLVITDEDGAVAGRVNLNTIVRGAWQSALLGYWVGAPFLRRGLATGAVGDALHWAFVSLGLHRVQADVMVENAASQGVLAKHGFVQFGRAKDYLFLNGAWRECLQYQLIATDWGR